MTNHFDLAARLHDAGIPEAEALAYAKSAFRHGPVPKRKSVSEQRGSLLLQARVLRHRAATLAASLHAQADAIESVVAEHYPASESIAS